MTLSHPKDAVSYTHLDVYKRQHEDGHFESGAFYKPFSVYQVKQQAENKAWRSAFRKRIPWCELTLPGPCRR